MITTPEFKRQVSKLFQEIVARIKAKASDIDILVNFNGRIGIGFIKLAHELEDLFKQKIDLVSRRAIKPRYLPFVEKSLIHV